MEEYGTVLYVVCFIISIVLISFFVLCSNIAQIKKHIVDDFNEYKIQLKIGDKKKAYYHLQWAAILRNEKEMYSSNYYLLFKKLDEGIPDFEEFKPFIEEDKKNNWLAQAGAIL